MPLEAYRTWKARNAAVGCMFARLIANSAAKDHARFKYRSELVTGADASGVAGEIARRVAANVDDSAVDGLALVLNDVSSLEQLVDITTELGKEPCWTVAKSVLKDTPIGDALAFHLSRSIPFRGEEIMSEALILGPFAPAFPNTRCAPVTALEIYVGVPAPDRDFTGKATTKAHLALININAPPPMFQTLTTKTKEIRLASLGGMEDARAKAKVTFSIPMALAAKHGCIP